jgi:transposase
MSNIKRQHSASFKAKIAMELIKNTDTINAICSKYSIHPTQASMWKQQALTAIESGFNKKSDNNIKQKDELVDQLYRQIGQLTVERDWLKKKFSG